MALRGTNETLPLSDLIQSSATQRRTARILTESHECSGQIYLVKGQVVHATYGDLVGDEAVYAMIAAHELAYEVEPGVATSTRTITAAWQELLLDAARHEDEGSLPRPVSGPTRGAEHEPDITQTSASRLVSEAPQFVERPASRAPVWLGLGVAAIATGVLGWVALRDRGTNTPDAASEPTQPVEPSAALDTRVYEVSELDGPRDRPPRLVHGAPAIAPRATSLTPSVIVRVELDAAGKLVERTIVQPRPELADYEAAALAALAHYEFAPAQRDGQAVGSRLNVPVGFDQPDPRGRRAVRVQGSDTIGGELAPLLAGEYAQREPQVLVTVEALGSSSGFTGLFEGSAELGASSRSIEPSELGEAEGRGVRLREWVIGYDGVAVIVHHDNPVRELDMVELAGVFSGEITNWQQVGGEDRAIQPLGRPAGSGTHGFFLHTVLEREGEGRKFATNTRELDTSHDLVAAVADDPAAIAYVGAAWLGETVTALAISPDAGAPAIAPTPSAITRGSYPIHRPLIFYARDQLDRDSANFLRFVLGERGQAIVAQQGFVPVGAQAEETLPSASPNRERSGVYVTRLYFSTAETTLDADQQAKLDALVTRLDTSPNARVIVVASATLEGLVEGHQRIADLRAASVRGRLTERGLASTRIDQRALVNLGGSNDPERSAEHRRVDVFVVDAPVATGG